jgi:hypothetical protein
MPETNRSILVAGPKILMNILAANIMPKLPTYPTRLVTKKNPGSLMTSTSF